MAINPYISPEAHGIMFHHFHNEVHADSQGSILAEDFEKILDYLSEHNKILPAELWFDKALKGQLEANELCLTFDDALLCQYDIAAPVMRKRGLTAFWFVYSSVFKGNIEFLEVYRHFRTNFYEGMEDFYQHFFESFESLATGEDEEAYKLFDPNTYLKEFSFYSNNDRRFRFIRDKVLGPDRYTQVMSEMMARKNVKPQDIAKKLWMSDEQLLDLKKSGDIVGLHSYTHPTAMSALSPDQQEYQYTQNKKHLDKLLGSSVVAMSHPCNSYNSTTLNILNSLGVQLGFCSNMSEVTDKSSLEFPREDHINVFKRMNS